MSRRTETPRKPGRPARTTPTKGRKTAQAAKVRRNPSGAGRKKRAEKKLSRLRKPEAMSLEAWQVALRRQFGREQDFRLKNVGDEPIFSEFEVTNPESKRTYRVAIRGAALGENFCSCPDFAVNTLGTCKHVEFVLERLGRKRGGKAALALGHRPVFSEVYLHYGARREVVFHPGTECPARLKTLAARYFDANSRLTEDGYAGFHEFLKRAGDSGHECRCYPDALGFIAEVRDKARLEELVTGAFPKGTRSAAFKKLLKVQLFDYQRVGALTAAKRGRCLIADDMGLGKTIQAIAAAEILARVAGIQRVLVVSPTSLKHQWKQEIERFTDREALVVEGLGPRRNELYAAESFYKLTNYDVIHRDVEAIRRWQPDLIILDEAQRIKNWKTRAAQAVKQLESKHALVLTGTPLENRLEELYSIIEFVDRFRLGPMFRFLAEHQHVDENGRVVGYRHLSEISKTLEPILIRRTKDKVLKELPERMEKRLFVPMTDEQRKHHDENAEAVARVVQKWRRFGFLNESDQLRLRICLQNMRMSCNSTYLLDHETDHGVKADELADLLADMFEDRQCKVVVFSQWLRMHEVVIRRLDRRKWQHVLFHGGVPGPHRKDLVHRFKEDPDCRLFLSTDAGGVGLNLQNATAVVNLDQPWNPAVVEQRIGRVHRLGQHRPVRVVHFVAQGTIEEGMLGLLAFKSAMFAGVLDAGQDEVFMGGTRLKRFMESVEKATGAIPQSMPGEPDRAAGNGAGERGEAAGQGEQAERGEPAGPGEWAERGERAAAATPSAVTPAAAAQQQAWADVLSTGMSLLDKLGQALGAGTSGSRPAAGPRTGSGVPATLLARDEQTGQPYLKVPMPEPEMLQKIAELFAALTKRR